jgi:hypothetical protein
MAIAAPLESEFENVSNAHIIAFIAGGNAVFIRRHAMILLLVTLAASAFALLRRALARA